jgi:hypothetical protein
MAASSIAFVLEMNRNVLRRALRSPRSLFLCALLFLLFSCQRAAWRSDLPANPRQVARALDDPVELVPDESFPASSLPVFPPPRHVRPCCAFGMDLQVGVGPARVPGYEKRNVISVDDLRHHGYDDGNFATDHNGILYTCRGGFIDSAHIRDNADRTLYLAMEIARGLPGGFTVELPDEGTRRRVRVKPMPKELSSSLHRLGIATAIAEWASYELSIWHEIVTWYGWESVKGFSERLSAFSPEDLYSNLLGIRIAGGIIANRDIRTQQEYEAAMDAWMREALRRLLVVPKDDARSAMKAVDGLWWSSKEAIPHFKLVTHRNLGIDPPLSPWLIGRASLSKTEKKEPARICPSPPPPLELHVPSRIGAYPIEELATVEFEFSDWIPEHFPVPIADGRGKVITQADFPKIMTDIRREGKDSLGPDFDRP